MTPAPLLVDEVTSPQALRGLLPDWEALANQVSPRLPFHHPWWHINWFDTFAENRLAIRDSLSVRVLRRASGELVGVAPMMLTERPSRGPLRLRVLQFLGADPNITELRGVVFRPECEAEVYGALIADLRRQSSRWDMILWAGVPEGGLAEALVMAEPGVESGRSVPDYLLDLPSTWDAFRAGLSRNIKEALRKCANAPKREGLTLDPSVAISLAEVDAALPRFFALHSARSTAQSTVVHRDVFSSERAKRFLRVLARQPGERLRLYQIRHAGKVIASRIAFVLGDTLYLYYSGYDLDYSRYSVMTTCTAFAIRHAIESGLKVANLTTGEDVSKTRWGPRRLLFREALWISPSARGDFTRRAYSLLQSARSSVALSNTPLVRLFSLSLRRDV